MAGRREAREDRAAPTLVPIPKPGGVRWLATLDPADDADYRAAAAGVAPRVERFLGTEVVANRTIPATSELRLEPWPRARRRFRRLAAGLRPMRALLVVDVVECYGSIGPDAVGSALKELGCRPDATGALVNLLRSFEERGVSGLPVGPPPSALLANAVLSTLDRALRGMGLPHLRWVDDVVVAAPDAHHAIRALDRLERALARMALHVNDAKTRIVQEPEEARIILAQGRVSGPCA